jgi:COP9 signalosome complex subunit 7
MAMDTDDVAARVRVTDPASAAAPTAASRPAVPQAGPSFAPPPKLEPFLLLAKSARGAGAAKLVEQATAAAGVYVFAELLETSGVADVCSSSAALFCG